MSITCSAGLAATGAPVRRRAPERRWAAGASVEIDDTTAWEIVVGVVLLRREAESGASLVLEILGPGSVLGPAMLPGPVTVHAATALCLRRLPVGLALQGMQRRVAALHERSVVVSYGSATQRVSWLLSELTGPRADGDVTLALRQTDMASYLGLTPETIARILTAMRESGLLGRVQRGAIEVLRPEALRALHEAPLRRRRSHAPTAKTRRLAASAEGHA